METTNVKPSDLNYDQYTSDKYNQDIVNSIPFHRELHTLIADFIRDNYDQEKDYHIIDLGVGTAITSRIVKDLLPKAEFDLVDFSEQMLDGAKKAMGNENVNYLLGDYSKMDFEPKYDIALSVIGIHHQNAEGKKILFKKIYDLLKPDGVFVFGDLVTYKDKKQAALSHAKHYAHLAKKSANEETLKEWAHHHMFLNDLSPIEDQIDWLNKVGFRVEKRLLEINTALLICTKKIEK